MVAAGPDCPKHSVDRLLFHDKIVLKEKVPPEVCLFKLRRNMPLSRFNFVHAARELGAGTFFLLQRRHLRYAPSIAGHLDREQPDFLQPGLPDRKTASLVAMRFANHRPPIVPVMHNNLMNRNRRCQNPVPLSVPEIASHRHGLPRRCRERFCRIPYRWLSKIRLPAAQARMKACPHAGMQRCRQTDCAMRATATLPSFCRRPDAAGEGDPSRKPGPVLRAVPLWSARCRALLRDPGNLACNEVTLPGQPNHPFMIIPQPTPLQGGSPPGSGVEPSKMIPVPQQP